MIRNFTPRLYQETILNTCIKANTLVVLPTGLGKTNIFLMLSSHRLQQYPKSKVLFIGPTRPLIDQYRKVFEQNFEIDKENLVTLTGMVSPKKRSELWEKGRIFFSTPQGLENDILSKRIKLEEVSLLGVDEAHRAVKDYAYVFIAKKYQEVSEHPRILALTASPGNDVATIRDVCSNLSITEIEVRTHQDPDVKQYVQEIDVQWAKVSLPVSFEKIRKFLQNCIKEKIMGIKEQVQLPNGIHLENGSKKELLGLQGALQARMMQGERDFGVMRSLSLLAEIIKTQHALELLESQGITALELYLQKIEEQAKTGKTKAVQNLVKDINFRSARFLARELFEKNIEHPKFDVLKDLVRDTLEANKSAKIMVFTQYRDTAQKIKQELMQQGSKTELFVGQTKKGETGMSQKEQKSKLESFGSSEFNVLVSTSIGEEGLDVPSVDLVVFFEPVPSAIRSIQRRGRTGRQEKGNVVVLVASGTRDEAFRWSAHHKELLMHRTLHSLKTTIGPLNKTEKKLTDFEQKNQSIKILVDHREKGSGTLKQLLDLGVDIELRQLSVGDYVCSARCAIESKTVEDFVDSIVDGRLLLQLKDLKKNYERPVVLMLGESDIYSVRKVHPNAINGMLAAIAVSYGIPIVRVRNEKEAANMILAIAKREQEDNDKQFDPHSEKRAFSLKEQQEYIISSLPGVGPALSKPMLQKFGSVKGVINASEKDLQQVELIGEKKSKDIRKVLDSDYKE